MKHLKYLKHTFATCAFSATSPYCLGMEACWRVEFISVELASDAELVALVERRPWLVCSELSPLLWRRQSARWKRSWRGGERRRRAAVLWCGGKEGWQPVGRGGESHVGARRGSAGTAMRSRCGRTSGMGASATENPEKRKSKSGILFFFSNAVPRATAHRWQLPTDSIGRSDQAFLIIK
jgi:hypothetical protein